MQLAYAPAPSLPPQPTPPAALPCSCVRPAPCCADELAPAGGLLQNETLSARRGACQPEQQQPNATMLLLHPCAEGTNCSPGHIRHHLWLSGDFCYLLPAPCLLSDTPAR
jgi:hypothetical protein